MIHLMVLCLAAADGGMAGSGVADGGVSGGVSDGGIAAYDAGNPATWRLEAKLKGPLREQLIADFTKKEGGVGETALTREEATALLDDPRASQIYGDKTVSIVAPSMTVRHRQEHVDMMKLFLAPERVEAGAKFMKDKDEVLAATEKRTGVDRQVIIGILMWESKLGTITGNWFAFNALASQAFFIEEANAIALAREEERALLSGAGAVKKDPKKKKLSDEELAKIAEAKAAAERKQRNRVESIRNRGRKNLVALVRQCKSRGIDPLSVKGSWAGALGFPQFMPASLRWAEDGNGDGKIDLFEMDDAIASVGRYLASAGFKKSARDAVYDYNHEEAYVQGVLAFAAALKKPADAGAP